jgi:hypothetical protein
LLPLLAALGQICSQDQREERYRPRQGAKNGHLPNNHQLEDGHFTPYSSTISNPLLFRTRQRAAYGSFAQIAAGMQQSRRSPQKGFPVVNRHFGKKLREKENERHEQYVLSSLHHFVRFALYLPCFWPQDPVPNSQR